MQRMDKEKKNIVLTGFMGTGKTTVGKLLAAELGYEFIDTDSVIETRGGRSIPGIFRESGEDVFRRLEADLVLELAEREGLVIATGGRLMLDPANAAALSHQGLVFCLAATPDEILSRVMNNQQSRPLLDVTEPGERIVELLEERAEGYRRFYQVMTNDKSPEEITRELVDLFRYFAAPKGDSY
jgi:shikimate kinase